MNGGDGKKIGNEGDFGWIDKGKKIDERFNS